MEQTENFRTVKPNERGCMPIFYLELTCKWKTDKRHKAFKPAVTYRMVYKGSAIIAATEKLKHQFLKIHFGKNNNEVSEAAVNTFVFVKADLIKHLGYEIAPNI